ncbi:MAG: pyridoxamine 5'-phosphate oxidase family protein [Planctomycetia bacterium]|nr:pyridoxamine 5'-phosphate oxidase family protein [Planctomycetia bacterium]
MDPAASHLLGELIRGRSVASLATLHVGLPFASMVPYAVWHDDATERLLLVTHVSRLSAHTRDMLETPQVCLLITAPETGEDLESVPPQALPRVSIPAVASFIDREHADYSSLALAYLEKFPFAADWFQLGDFSIVAFAPSGSARFIAGFARAMTVSVAQLRAAIGGAAT